MRSITIILVISMIASVIMCCPEGWKLETYPGDTLEICSKDNSYGRGAGYPWKYGDVTLSNAKKRCLKDHPECEIWGSIYYPKCKKYYSNDGCCICRIKSCPSGYKKEKEQSWVEERFYCRNK